MKNLELIYIWKAANLAVKNDQNVVWEKFGKIIILIRTYFIIIKELLLSNLHYTFLLDVHKQYINPA